MSEDPLWRAGQGLYSYAGNRATGVVDPSGAVMVDREIQGDCRKAIMSAIDMARRAARRPACLAYFRTLGCKPGELDATLGSNSWAPDLHLLPRGERWYGLAIGCNDIYVNRRLCTPDNPRAVKSLASTIIHELAHSCAFKHHLTVRERTVGTGAEVACFGSVDSYDFGTYPRPTWPPVGPPGSGMWPDVPFVHPPLVQ